MRYTQMQSVIVLVVLITVAGFAPASIPASGPVDSNREPELPSPLCDSLHVVDGKVAFRAYATGVQVYRWNGASWTLVEPVATLFADANYHSRVGIHYAGPTWESNSGSKVVAAREADCLPDPSAIPWLRLQTLTTDGPGIFESVTSIQRVNTTGGRAPSAPGSSVGAVAQVPYTAEYYFYR